MNLRQDLESIPRMPPPAPVSARSAMPESTLRGLAAQPAASDFEAGEVAGLCLRYLAGEKSKISEAAQMLAAAQARHRDAERDLAAALSRRRALPHLAETARRLTTAVVLEPNELLQRAARDHARDAAREQDEAEALACKVPELESAVLAMKNAVGDAQAVVRGEIAAARANLRRRCLVEYERHATGLVRALAVLKAMSEKPQPGEDWSVIEHAVGQVLVPALRTSGGTAPIESLWGRAVHLGRDGTVLPKHVLQAQQRLGEDLTQALGG